MDESQSLEEFIDLDDKMRFNKAEYSLINVVAEQQHLVKRRFANDTEDILEFRNTLSKFDFKNP